MNRYPGSRPFEDTPIDRLCFFGRQQEAQRLLHLILDRKLSVLFADTGLGKTSLLRASTFASLRAEGFFPILTRVGHAESPSDREPTTEIDEPIDNLFASLDEVLLGAVGKRYDLEVSAAPGSELETRLDRFEDDLCPGDLLRACRAGQPSMSLWRLFSELEIWHGSQLLIPVLVVDQFEELFRNFTDPQRRRFAQTLAQVARDSIPTHELDDPPADAGAFLPSPNMRIVLSIREDWVGALDEFSALIPGVLDNRFRLLRLTPEQAKDAIEGPTRAPIEEDASPFTIDPPLVDEIVEHLCQRTQGTRGEVAEGVEPFRLQWICSFAEAVAHEQRLDVVRREHLGAFDRIVERIYLRHTYVKGNPLRTWRLRRLCASGLIRDQDRDLAKKDRLLDRFNVPDEDFDRLVEAHLVREFPRLDTQFCELSHQTLIRPILEVHRRLRQFMVAAGLVLAALGLLITFTRGSYQRSEITADKRAKDLELVALETLAQNRRAGHPLAGSPVLRDSPAVVAEPDAPADPFMDLARLTEQALALGRPFDELPAAARLALSSTVELAAETSRHPVQTTLAAAGGDRLVTLQTDQVTPRGQAARELRALDFMRGRASFETISLPKLSSGLGEITVLALSPDGRLVAAGDETGNLYLQALDEQGTPQGSPRAIRPAGNPSNIVRLVFGPRSRYLAILFKNDPDPDDDEVQLFFLRTRTSAALTPRIRHPIDPSVGLALIDSGDRKPPVLATTDRSGRLQLWTLEKRAFQPLGDPRPSPHRVKLDAAAVSPDGTLLVTGGRDGILHLWDTDTGSERQSLILAHRGPVRAIHFYSEPEGETRFVSVGDEGTVRFWNTDGEHLDDIVTAPSVDRMAISDDGKHIAIASREPSLRIWTDQRLSRDRRFPQLGDLSGLVFDPKNRLWLASQQGSILCWNPEKDDVRQFTPWDGAPGLPATAPFAGDVSAFGLDPRASAAVLGTGDGRLFFGPVDDPWGSALTTQPYREPLAEAGEMLDVAIARDGRVVAGGRASELVLIDANGQRQIMTALEDYFERYLVAVDVVERAASDDPSSTLRVSAVSHDGRVGIVDWESGGAPELVQRFEARHHNVPVLLSTRAEGNTGSLLITGSTAGQVEIFRWDPVKEEITLEASAVQKSAVTALAIDVERGWVASGSRDGSIHLWTLEGEPILAQLTGHRSPVLALDFAGQLLWSQSRDDLRSWELTNPRILSRPFPETPVQSTSPTSISKQSIRSKSTEDESTVKGPRAKRPTVLAASLRPSSDPSQIHLTTLNTLGRLAACSVMDHRWECQPLSIDESFSRDEPAGKQQGPWILHPSGAFAAGIRANGSLGAFGPDVPPDEGCPKTALSSRQAMGKERPSASTSAEARPTFLAWVGEAIAWTESDGLISLCDYQNQRIQYSGISDVLSLASLADGSLVATGHKRGLLNFWRPADNWTRTVRWIDEFDEPRGNVQTLLFDPAGEWLTLGTSNGIVQRLSVGRMLETLEKALPTFEGDSDDEAQGVTHSVVPWKPTDDEPQWVAHNGTVEAMVLDPRRQLLITSGSDRTIQLWNFQGQRIASPIRSLEGPVAELDLSDDGTILLSRTLDDGTLRLWDPRVNWLEHACHRLLGHQDHIESHRGDAPGGELDDPAQRVDLEAARKACDRYLDSLGESNNPVTQ